ncbi:MAG: OmpH family outer membrane protein [Bacteroidaceae bacterium]
MKRLFTVLLLALPLSLPAQIQFGYMSYKTVMAEMPEFAQVKQSMAELKAKYDAEATRGEEEFQKKFVDFLQGQKDFPQTIMQKRQAELQSLMENGISFRMESQKTIEQAEKDLVAEVKKKLNNVILEVGVEYGYAFVLNTDDDACPFINPVIGVDVTDLVRWKLGLLAEPPVGLLPAVTPQNESVPEAENVPAEQPVVPEAQPVVQPVQEQTQP